jgi:hypothetical protein
LGAGAWGIAPLAISGVMLQTRADAVSAGGSDVEPFFFLEAQSRAAASDYLIG